MVYATMVVSTEHLCCHDLWLASKGYLFAMQKLDMAKTKREVSYAAKECRQWEERLSKAISEVEEKSLIEANKMCVTLPPKSNKKGRA